MTTACEELETGIARRNLLTLAGTAAAGLATADPAFAQSQAPTGAPGSAQPQEPSTVTLEKIARVPDEKHAQLWINHDGPSSDARRHAPEFYE